MASEYKNEFEGGATEFGGSVKETIGQMTNDADLEREGKFEKVKGKAQAGLGKLQHKLGDALEDLSVNLNGAGDRLRD